MAREGEIVTTTLGLGRLERTSVFWREEIPVAGFPLPVEVGSDHPFFSNNSIPYGIPPVQGFPRSSWRVLGQGHDLAEFRLQIKVVAVSSL